MLDGGWQGYALIFAGSAFLSLVLTPLALRLALSLQVLDHPGDRKGHSSPVPYLGGAAIVVSFAAAVALVAVLRPPVSGLGELGVVLGVAVALSLVGLLDDTRGLGPWVRFVVEVAAGAGVWAAGAGVDLFSLEVANAIVTIMWVVGITNAFNLLDNMDGLSAGVAAIGAGWFFIISATNGQFLVASLAAALAGCAVGFLRHNFHPARIYMGDAGSLFLGFLLAYLGLKLRFDAPEDVTSLVPILVLGIAILDTSLVSVARLANGQSPFQGGLDHMSHRLVFMGIPVRAAVILIYGAAISVGLIGLVVSRVDRVSAYLLAGLMAAGGLFVGILLGRVPVYRRHEAWQHVDAERATELAGSVEYEEETGRPPRNRQARLGSLFTSARVPEWSRGQGGAGVAPHGGNPRAEPG